MIRTNALGEMQSLNEKWAVKNAGFGDGRIMSDIFLDFVSMRRFNPATKEMTVVYSAAYHGKNNTFAYCGFNERKKHHEDFGRFKQGISLAFQ